MLFKKRFFLAVLLLCCACFLISVNKSRAAGINQMQMTGNNAIFFDVGFFSPTGDLDDYNYDTGYNFSLGYQAFPWRFFGFEIAGSYKYTDRSFVFENTAGTWDNDRDVTVGGLEILGLAKYDIAAFQTYGGLGLGYYYSEYSEEANLRGSDYSFSDSADGSDLGYIIKLGARYFINYNFFIGANFKYTLLEIDYSWDWADFSSDSDGYGINLEMGYSF